MFGAGLDGRGDGGRVRAGGADGGDDLGAAVAGHSSALLGRHATGGADDQDGAEIVDVGEGRAGDDQVAEGGEQAVAVVVGKARPRVDAACARPGKCVGLTIAPALSSVPSMPSVSPASA